MQVEIFSDVVCPWCYLGKRRFERALAGFGHRAEVAVVFRSFQLDPAAPSGPGEPAVEMLARKYGMSPEQAEQTQRQMERRAAADGLDYHLAGQRSGNTRDAHRLLHHALDAHGRGGQDALAERLFAAHFTEQRSVFERDSLVTLAAEAGLGGDEARAVLDGDRHGEDVDRDVAEAHALGVTGVPFFVLDRRYGISGAQPLEVMADALNRAWAASGSGAGAGGEQPA